MRWLLFLSRLAFICGFCFLLSLSFLLWKRGNDEVISQTIIIIGFVIGLIVVPFTLLCYLVILASRKKIPVPLWLVICNIIFMFVLMFYLLFINVEGHYTP
ncbi:MAG TPA: hypothetical protein VIZ28_17830 [Chitinophagaceae bacterium]